MLPAPEHVDETTDQIERDTAASSSTDDGDVLPESSVEQLPEYSVDEEELIYYGEVLAYRYGIDVPPDEWLRLAEQECTTFTDEQSTSVYGPAVADTLDDDPRAGLLLESFVFLVIGTDMCDSGFAGSGFERFGSEALLVSIAFMTTVSDTSYLDFSVPDFADYYDNQLDIVRYDTSYPSEPGYSDSYGDYEEYEADPPDYSEAPRDGTVPGPPVEYEGNAGGPTLCGDGTVSNSSGRGTCSHHGGER